VGGGLVRISPERLASAAHETGFNPDVLEKVAQLLVLLAALQGHPFLTGKLVLKGGTALNLFVFDVPRLSVDIDLNYIGGGDREVMIAERPGIERALQAVFEREGFAVRRMPEEHAGGKWSLRYEASSGRTGNVEVDVNFMYRVPLWPVEVRDSFVVGGWHATEVPVLDLHELAAGKLAALLARRQARDLFDSRHILQMEGLDRERLRIAFVVYGAMNRKDWRKVSPGDVEYDAAELARQLIPTLRQHAHVTQVVTREYGSQLVDDCRKSLSAVLPFTTAENAFLDLLLDRGVLDPSRLTSDVSLQDRIRQQPMLEWKALHVRQFKKPSV
jgi:predicted nucleotidyltransferase component of viral defense system